MRRISLVFGIAALLPAASARADSQSFTISTGYNESALTTGLNRGTGLQARVARGRQLFTGSIDSRGLASVGIGRIAASQDDDVFTSRYPVLTVFGRSGEGSGFALDLHQDWFWRGTPRQNPGKHVTMFQTQGSIICQVGEAPKVRVTHRFVTTPRRHPGRSQGVEWVWEFHRDYPATYQRSADRGEMSPLLRRSMRAENWTFFSRELGVGVARVSIGATHKTVTREPAAVDPNAPAIEQATASTDAGTRRVPVLMFRLAYEVRRW